MNENAASLCISLVVTGVLISFFNSANIFYGVLILGQAHFAIAYLYSYKAGKMNGEYALKFVGALLFFGAISYFVYTNNNYLTLYIFWIFMMFVQHYAIDELKMSGIHGLHSRAQISLVVTLSFAAFMCVKLFGFPLTTIFYFLIPQYALLALFVYKNYERLALYFRRDYVVYIFFMLNILLPYFLACLDWTEANMVSGFIILLHYTRWYIFYYLKFVQAKDTVSLNYYLRAVLSVNALVILLFMIHSLNYEDSQLIYYFSQSFFFGWTGVHIYLSFRKGDLKII